MTTRGSTNPNPAPVSIAPSRMVEPSLFDYTIGDVIKLIYRQEAGRRRDDGEESQRDVPITFRNAPEGLIPAINSIAITVGMGKSVVTKCLSQHAVAWYQSMPQVRALVDLYERVYLSSDGHADATRLLDYSRYEFGHGAASVTRTSLRTIGFVLGYLGEIHEALGVSVYQLLLSGMCWSISTNTDGWSKQFVTQYLKPEAVRMEQHLSERLLWFRHVLDLVRLRSGNLDIEDYADDLRQNFSREGGHG